MMAHSARKVKFCFVTEHCMIKHLIIFSMHLRITLQKVTALLFITSLYLMQESTCCFEDTNVSLTFCGESILAPAIYALWTLFFGLLTKALMNCSMVSFVDTWSTSSRFVMQTFVLKKPILPSINGFPC